MLAFWLPCSPTLNSFGFTATLETTFVLLLHYIGSHKTTLPRLIDARVAHERLMRHGKISAERIFSVYEALVANFKSQVHQILNFLKLPIDDSCQFINRSVVMTPS